MFLTVSPSGLMDAPGFKKFEKIEMGLPTIISSKRLGLAISQGTRGVKSGGQASEVTWQVQ